MKITYDKEVNAAYIYLTQISDGEITRSVPVEEIPANSGEIILDFDNTGKLRGIELLDADKTLDAEILAKAEQIDVKTIK